MRFVEESVPDAHLNTYPDMHGLVDSTCSAPLDPDTHLISGTLGTISYNNFDDSQVSSRLGEPAAFLWMTPVSHHLENDFSPSQPFVQYEDSVLLYPPSPPDGSWSSSSCCSSSSSLSQWDGPGAVPHFDSLSTFGYYADQTADSSEDPYRRQNIMTANPFIDDFRGGSIARDCVSGPAWDDGIAVHGIEQPSYLSIDDSPQITASTIFADHNLDFGLSPRITGAHSYEVYPTPPLTPESLPHGHDRRHHISLPVRAPHAAPATNQWKCPYCNYVQGRRRMVDLKRHIATHTKPSDVALWTCCGYPREAARSKGVPDDVIRETSAIYGRVGGCWETFSRRDALQRHLRKQKGRCFGDAYAEWHPGNNNKRDRQTKARAHVDDSSQWDD